MIWRGEKFGGIHLVCFLERVTLCFCSLSFNPERNSNSANTQRKGEQKKKEEKQNMRRKAGISSLLPNPTLQSSYKAVASEIQLSQIQAYQAQTETFKTQLQKFAQKHAKEIKRSPEFRRQFQKMCAEMGVDPLQCKKGYFEEGD